MRERSRGSSNGSSQKGIGRLAALSLNGKCHDKDISVAAKNGFFVFSRTSSSGEIRFIEVVPEKIETDGGTEVDRFITPSSEEARFLNNIEGSFTAIVIPTPVFDSADEIIESIKWLLPREANKMFDLRVNGKKVAPPELQSAVNITWDGDKYRARLGAFKKVSETDEATGIWLCDEETGFRVASCVRMGSKFMPMPLWYPDIVGDIFVPGLLRHQGTARNKLSDAFTRKWDDEWRKLLLFLSTVVAPAAKNLLDNDVEETGASKALEDLVTLFHGCYGLPPEKEPGGGSGGTRIRTKSPTTPDDKDRPKEEPKPRHKTIKIRDEVYHLYTGRSLDPDLFAEVAPHNSQLVYVNVRGAYKSLPKNLSERKEHMLMLILIAIGLNENVNNPEEALKFASSRRADFFKK